MTVESLTRRVLLETNGSVRVFPFNFRIFDESHLRVFIRDTDGDDTELFLGYEKNLNDAGDGGNVTFITEDPPEANQTVIILRDVPVDRMTDYAPNADLRSSTLNNDMDKYIMIAQDLKDGVDRSIKFGISTSDQDATIEGPEPGMCLAWDEDGNLVNIVNPAIAAQISADAAAVSEENAAASEEAAELAKDITEYWAERAVSAADEGFKVEIDGTIVMTDSEGSTAEELAPLYDRNNATSVDLPADGFVDYTFGIIDYIDKVVIKVGETSTTYKVYFSITSSGIGGVTEPRWFAGDETHGLDENNYLTEHDTEGEASDDYFILSPGTNDLSLPERVTGNICRVYVVGTGVLNVSDLQFQRQIIAEQIYAEELSAINANLGTVTAGSLMSGNLTATSGIWIDLSNDRMYLGGNEDPAFYYDGEAAGFTVGEESFIDIVEGGKLLAGDGNIMLTGGNTGDADATIIIGSDGTVDKDTGEIQPYSNYTEITEGSIKSYTYVNGAHREFRSIGKVAIGVVANDTWVDLGYFPAEPVVQLSPANLQSYNTDYKLQNQSFRLEVQDLRRTSEGTWEMKPYAQLVLTGGGGTETVDEEESNTANCDTYMTTEEYTTPINVTGVTINLTYQTQQGTGTTNQYNTRYFKWRPVIDDVEYSWQTEYPGNTLDEQTATRVITGLANGQTHDIYIEACAGNAGGTFYGPGGAVYEYEWRYNTNTYNDTEYVESLGNGDQNLNTSTWVVPNPPSSYSGWIAMSSTHWKMNYKRYLYLDAGAGHTQIMDIDGLSDFVGWGGTANTGFQFDTYERITSGTYGTDDWSDTITDTYSSNNYGDDLRLRLGANSAYGGDGETKNGIELISLQAGRRFYREVPGSTAVSNTMTFTTYNYTLGDYQVLASGTVSYLAIDSGGPVYSEKATVSGAQPWTNVIDAMSAPASTVDGQSFMFEHVEILPDCYGAIKMTTPQTGFYQSITVEALESEAMPTLSGVDIWLYGYDSNLHMIPNDYSDGGEYGGDGSGYYLDIGYYLIETQPHYIVLYNTSSGTLTYRVDLMEAV